MLMPVATVILLQHRLGISATWFKISRLKGRVLQTRLGGVTTSIHCRGKGWACRGDGCLWWAPARVTGARAGGGRRVGVGPGECPVYPGPCYLWANWSGGHQHIES